MDEEQSFFGKRSYFSGNSIEFDRSKIRHLIGPREPQDPTSNRTVYRYLCPKRKAGVVIGKGGGIMKHIRMETSSWVMIEDDIHGCEERVVTICSSSKEINSSGYNNDYTCPAQDALFRVHERVVRKEVPLDCNKTVDLDASLQVNARLLIASDQARCIIGRRGCTINGLRRESGSQINIWNDERIPLCANIGEELLQISGDALRVRDALFQITCLLHEFPSRSQHILSGSYLAPRPRFQVENGVEFSLRLVCPSVNIRDVIGKDGSNINQIRQETGATINLDCVFDEEDCMILITAKEFEGSSNSPCVEAAAKLQPWCSRKVERWFNITSNVVRLLVSRSQVGGLIGKKGFIIKKMRRNTQTIIFITEESLPCFASVDDAMVQISGDLLNVKDSLIQVINQLKAVHFARKGLLFTPHFPSSDYRTRNDNGSDHTGRSFEQEHSHSRECSASVDREPLEILGGSSDQQAHGDS